LSFENQLSGFQMTLTMTIAVMFGLADNCEKLQLPAISGKIQLNSFTLPPAVGEPDLRKDRFPIGRTR